MIAREAVRILMLSPIYFRLTARQRLELVKEYCQDMNKFNISREKKC
ncbi:MAG: hypothetical protein WGN25_16155 [Candidatus Electrothrix sp. GW3-4]